MDAIAEPLTPARGPGGGQDDRPDLKQAVLAAEKLLAFAVETSKPIEAEAEKRIVSFIHGFHRQSYDAKSEEEFWSGYRKLCVAVQPVTPESLAYSTELAGDGRSPASRSIRLYAFGTSVVLVLLLLFQLYWVFVSQAHRNINKHYAEIHDLNYDNVLLQRQFIDDANFSESAKKNVLENSHEIFGEVLPEKIVQTMGKPADVSRSQLEAVKSYAFLTVESRWRRYMPIEKSIDANIETMLWLRIVNREEYQTTLHTSCAPADGWCQWDLIGKRKKLVAKALQISAGYIEFLSNYLLPILYGIVGACAFILRELSRRITDKTMTRAWHIRLRIRWLLGALAGFSVAWFSKSEGTPLPTLPSITPFALAFVAGYGIELVFAAMDALIAAFSRGKSGQPA